MHTTDHAISRRHLLTAPIGAGNAVDRVEAAEITLAPGQRTGTHRHPCPVVGCVLAGNVRLQVDGQDAQTLGPGEPFYEPADTRIAAFDNASDTDPAVFVAFYLLPPGEERLIVMEQA
jgi:quercetin dioxygenase-like cupin family protein